MFNPDNPAEKKDVLAIRPKSQEVGPGVRIMGHEDMFKYLFEKSEQCKMKYGLKTEVVDNVIQLVVFDKSRLEDLEPWKIDFIREFYRNFNQYHRRHPRPPRRSISKAGEPA